MNKKHKKDFLLTPDLDAFIRKQPDRIKIQFRQIVEKLTIDGYLVSPYGKKMSGYSNLFEIRITHGGSVRVFYCYMKENLIMGLNGFVKKSQKTPEHEIKKALNIIRTFKEDLE